MYVYNNVYNLAAFLNKRYHLTKVTYRTLGYENEFHNKKHDNNDQRNLSNLIIKQDTK